MAAILCLVFLPLTAAVGFMIGAIAGDMSPASVFGGVTFVALAAFVLFGAFSLMRGWEGEPEH